MDLRQFFGSDSDARVTNKSMATNSISGPLAKFFECSPRVLRSDPGNNFDEDSRISQTAQSKRLKNNDSWVGVRNLDAPPVAKRERRKCECGKAQPSFGNPGDKPKDARWCAKCKPATAVDVVSKKCECGKAYPSFGNPGDKPKDAKWCAKCETKPETAVNVVSKKCECGKAQPSFGNPGDKPKWCADCKPETAVNVVRKKKCECGKAHPSFGNPGDKPKDAKWCAKCETKPETAVYVVRKMCECGKSVPTFGNPGDKPKDAKWCAKCETKPETAVDVASKKCECGKVRPSFGNPGDDCKDAKWCAECKPETAVNVRSKKCECGKSVPSFGNPGDEPKDAKWCADCKPETAVNVVSKKCECGKVRPSFGNPGDDCKDAKWCAECKPETAVNVRSKRCISNHCDTFLSGKGINNTGYCMGCFSHKFPESNIVRFPRCKELTVVKAIYEQFAEHEFAQSMVNDRRIQGGCSKKRPDICIDLATHVLVVEVDEFQHLRGDYSCENKRMMELFEDGRARPIVFLRFNPDKYTNEFGLTVPSPWTKTERGQPRIDPKRKDDWNKRLDKLFARIEYWTQLQDFPSKEVTVEFMFYNAC